MHPRRYVIDKVYDLLKDHTNAGDRVYKNRVRPVDPSELPCILIYSVSETETWQREIPLIRETTISIEILAEANSDLDETLDQIAAQVEEQIGATDNIENTVNEFRFISTTIEMVKEAGFPQGSAVLQYTAQYATDKITGEAIP